MPQAQDAKNVQQDSTDYQTLPGQVYRLGLLAPPTLLPGPASSPAGPTSRPLWPTPDASVMQDGETPETWLARRETLKMTAKNGNGCGTPLAMASQLWPTPTVQSDGDATACRGISLPRAAASKGSGRRLNPKFVAWLMGFDPSWVDEVPRVDALRCLGNAVVPAQGAFAIAVLWRDLWEAPRG